MVAHFYCQSAGGDIYFTEDHRYALMMVISREGHKQYAGGLDTMDLTASYLNHCYEMPAMRTTNA